MQGAVDFLGRQIKPEDLELTDEGREILTDIFMLMNMASNNKGEVEYNFAAPDGSGKFRMKMEYFSNAGRNQKRNVSS